MSIDTIDPVHNLVYDPEGPGLQAMADSFGEPLLPASEALDGRTIDLHYEGGWTIAHEFRADATMRWEVTEGEGAGESGEVDVRVVEARPEIFFVDFVKPSGENVSIVLDLATGRSTTAISTLYDRDGETRTQTEFSAATIDDLEPDAPHPPSSGMVGKRMLYRYSEQDVYEHVYLNPTGFAWQCLRGAEKGCADVDRCRAFEVDDDLYLFYWTETVAAVESVLLIDFSALRSIGRMFCWDRKLAKVVHVPYSSRATLLNETVYPEA